MLAVAAAAAALALALTSLPPSVALGAPTAEVFIAADPVHQLAALQLRRYLHLSSSSGLAACELRIAGVADRLDDVASAAAPTVPGFALLTAGAWQAHLPALVEQSDGRLTPASAARLVALAERLGRGSDDDHALLPIRTASGRRVIAVLGATDRSVLMGTYSLIERFTPVRFQLHGDVLPDRTTGSLPTLAELFEAGHAALGVGGVVLSPGDVSVRGLQPFHDFSEVSVLLQCGSVVNQRWSDCLTVCCLLFDCLLSDCLLCECQGPDWWNAAEYELLLDQMAKMKLNMIALHNYGQSLVEPTVWTGLETDFDHATGRLKKNGSYSASYITTSGGATWGGVPMNISDYLFGAQNAFASDCYGSDVMRRVGGCPDPMLSPTTPPKDQRTDTFDSVAVRRQTHF